VAAGPSVETRRAQLMKQTGDLYFALQMFSSAESWYRRLQKDRPDEAIGLIQALARLGKIGESASFAGDAMRAEQSATPVAAMVTSWAAVYPLPAAVPAVDELMAEALTRHATDVELLFAIGNLRLIQERSSEAMKLFEDVLRQNPKHVAALNNLAMMYGESETHRKKALPAIDKAIELAGTLPALLDTKAMTLVYSGDSTKALPLLEQAAAADKDPRYRFHMAIALDELDKAELAMTELHEALNNRLEEQVLTRGERQHLQRLQSKYPLRPAVRETKPGST
jgi:tetratricopeptide (TPR) repeat protein